MTFKRPKWRNFAKSGHTDSLSPVAKYFVVPKINLKGHRKSIAYWCMLLSHFSAMIYSFEPNESIIYQPKKCFKRPNSTLSYQKKKNIPFFVDFNKSCFPCPLTFTFFGSLVRQYPFAQVRNVIRIRITRDSLTAPIRDLWSRI